MLKSINILVNTRYNMNLKYYNNLGYDIDKEFILVDVKDLPPNCKEFVEVECDYCNKIETIKFIKYNRSMKSNIKKYACCRKCISIKTKESNITEFGVDSLSKLDYIKDKSKKSCLEKYGVEYANQSEIVKENIKISNIKKYGVDCVLKSPDIRKQIKETNIEKYGVDNPTKLKYFTEKIKLTNLKNFGFEYATKSDFIKEKTKKTNTLKYNTDNNSKNDIFRKNNYKIANDPFYVKYIGIGISIFNCDNNKNHTFEINKDNYNKRLNYNIPLCTICYPIGDQKSIKEKELLEFIKNVYTGEVIPGHRDGLEIDIYLPQLKIGFEFNGLYWHSNMYKDKNYHLNKTEHFQKKDIRIIHIWEDDWDLKRDIIKSQIKNWLNITENRIFARKCKIKDINDPKIVRRFLDNNHIQGFVSSKIKLGLYYNNELVSLMTFDNFEGRKRLGVNEWNLSRFCNNINTNVIGGSSKLLNYFIKKYIPNRIISYADKDWSVGEIYEKIGFLKLYESKPDYKYIVDYKRIHKSRYKKSKLNTELTESKFMRKIGIEKIYDCGKIKFELLPQRDIID